MYKYSYINSKFYKPFERNTHTSLLVCRIFSRNSSIRLSNCAQSEFNWSARVCTASNSRLEFDKSPSNPPRWCSILICVFMALSPISFERRIDKYAPIKYKVYLNSFKYTWLYTYYTLKLFFLWILIMIIMNIISSMVYLFK